MNKKLTGTQEDAFYESLTLGLMKTLSYVPRVCHVTLDRRQPLNPCQLVNWEQRHCVYLPEDMKKFYLSTDGFVLHWSYQYAPTDVRRVGYIHFPHLLQVTLLRENIENTPVASGGNGATATAPMPKDKWDNPTPIITAKTKIFEINNINEMAKVCMLYDSTSSNNPKFYLLELSTLSWQFLAETFSEYLRMAIAHLGLPYWELCFSSFGLPSWTEQLFLLLAPHLLEKQELRRGRIIYPACEHPYNILDPNIFRSKPKGLAKSSTSIVKSHK
ncbi:tubulin polyglutamylase complex subunit 2 [Drosophila hydei]|uniref:Tubulin polyglutamylase complex subunit 2 n=1 Tax=Drosophila hydei TaxID=7224 RepID=A0A6J1M1T7_DROHY|nr:tubulin polyglutamylase complex subunit 2 [Drosophila hydei]